MVLVNGKLTRIGRIVLRPDKNEIDACFNPETILLNGHLCREVTMIRISRVCSLLP